MREIKFRAWDKINKKMLKVVEIDFFRRKMYFTIDNKYYGECSLDDVILMQYTGLEDINEKEIYEGDILHLECMLISDEIPLDGVVVFEEGTWWVENEEERRAERLWGECNYLRVKGNIYGDSEIVGD
ncbi:YopX family protein [Clostridium sporogenes]